MKSALLWLRSHLYVEPRFVFRLLSPFENASLVGQGLARTTIHSAPGNGISRGGVPGRWTAPPLRTTGCLKEPESILPVAISTLSFDGCVQQRHLLARTSAYDAQLTQAALPNVRVLRFFDWGFGSRKSPYRIFVRDSWLMTAGAFFTSM